ncbi:hypothetical protein ACFWG0_36485 [Streptomyces yangpuensis]|uniref:hypothetical protein n=1 Tax=Streptomyces yangpuensis TaxID=1648182 RepID=UPI00365A4393
MCFLVISRIVCAWVVGEVADAIGVQLRRQLDAAPAEEQPAPERVALVPFTEGVQLNRLERQRQRVL